MSLDATFTEANRERCLIDIIDEEWAKDKLPDADFIVADMPFVGGAPADEEEEYLRELRAEGENLWTDLGIGHLVPKHLEPAPKASSAPKQK